jgi:PhnB protein
MPTATITPYLFFGGRCEEALAFYQQALGATIEMTMRYNESPDPVPPGMLPAGFETKIMHASFRVAGSLVMASDGTHDHQSFHGFRLALALPDEAQARQAFDALAEGGNVFMPLCRTFWSPCFGMLTDRFGVGWMVTLADETHAGN